MLLPSPIQAFFAAFLLLALAACGKPEVCREGQAPEAVPLQPQGAAGLHAFAHAHNDYEHDRPLLDALDARFYSVEADIFFSDGRFEVSHGGLSGSKGTLQELYLDPLQERVNANGGSVQGDGLPFTLWIDFKDNHEELPEKLEALLSGYPMLTSYEGEARSEGAVNVILTGDAAAKQAFVEQPVRHAVRDSNDFSPDDPPADARWRAYALSWGGYLGWNGEGEPSPEDARRLGCIVQSAREKGRKVRFYGAPDRPEVWGKMIEYGVDFIHTDKLKELESFLAERG